MEEERIPGPVIDPNKHTAAYKIFHYRFKCTIQPIHLYSEKVLKEGGFVTSGFAEIDRAAMHKFVPCHLLIAAMAEYADEGVPFYLTDPRDAVKIYQIIRQHLRDHLNSAHNDINHVKVSLDDLRKLDALAELIYPISRGMQDAHSLEEHEFFKKLRNLGGRNLLTMLNKPEAPSKPAAAGQPGGYESAIPGLTKAINARNKPWLNK